MAAKRKVSRKATRPARAMDAGLCEQAFQLRVQAGSERHGGTALELRVSALEKLVTALIDAR